MLTMGVDIGSASSKIVILENGKTTVSAAVVQAGTGSSGPGRTLEKALANIGQGLDGISYVVATGYGRNSCTFAHRQLSEISCHAKGIQALFPQSRTIIDIGGQDVKAIALDGEGLVSQFYMNDKCAAGTGRFLEVMSRVLEVPLEEMGACGERALRISSVSSTCTVFAESEVISQLSQGEPKENIVAGLHKSVASKACNLALRAGVREQVVMSGGVAKNPGVVKAISEELGTPVLVAENPQTIGALGAAIYAHIEYWNQRKDASR